MGNIDSSCELCQLFCTLKHHSLSSSQGLHLRAYSTFGYTRFQEFKRLPKSLTDRDMPHLAIVASNFTTHSSLDPGTRYAFCTLIPENCDRIFTPQKICRKVDYAAIELWLKCCESLHKSLCTRKEVTARPSKLIDCETLPPSLVQAAVSVPYLTLSYTWGTRCHKYRYSACYSGIQGVKGRSIISPIILCPPKTVSDAILVTQKLGYRYLWVDAYCIDQVNRESNWSQVKIMDKIYGNSELTIVAASGSHSNFGLPGVSTTPRVVPQQESGSVVTQGNIEIMCIGSDPRHLIRSSAWAGRAWTYQEAILSQRLLYFTECETYFECHSMQSRETMRWDWPSIHCKQGKLYSTLNSGLFLGRVSCTNSYIRAPLQSLWRYYELIRKYTARDMSEETDSLRAFAGIMRYLEDGKLPVYQLIGVPFLYDPGSAEKSNISFLVGLLWVHQRTFPPRKKFPLPHPTRRQLLPSWTWAGWKGEIDFLINTEKKYDRFESRAKIEYIEMQDGVQHDYSTLVPNLREIEEGLPCALVIKARLLRPETFTITFTESRPICRITSKLHPPGPHPNWDPSRPIRPSRKGCKPQPPRYYPGAKGVLYLYRGPEVYTKLSEFFDFNNLHTILIGICPGGTGRCGARALYFLVLEPKGDAFSRIGVLKIKESFENFVCNILFEGQDRLFEERLFNVV